MGVSAASLGFVRPCPTSLRVQILEYRMSVNMHFNTTWLLWEEVENKANAIMRLTSDFRLIYWHCNCLKKELPEDHEN